MDGENIASEAQGAVDKAGDFIKDKSQKMKDRVYALAAEHDLDPEHIEEWPKEIKDLLNT